MGGSGPPQSRGKPPPQPSDHFTSPLSSSHPPLPAGHSPTVNSTLRNLSNVYREQGQLDKAEELDKLTKQKVRVQKFNGMQIQPIFFTFLNETSPKAYHLKIVYFLSLTHAVISPADIGQVSTRQSV